MNRSPAAAPLVAASARVDTRLHYIDALRGIAALLVVWLHVADAFLHVDGGIVRGAWLRELAAGVDVGRVGVVAFFLISGFVIPFSIEPTRPAPVATFLIKRFFRIFPAYWLSIPLGALTGFWLLGGKFGGLDLLGNLTLLQGWLGVPEAEGLYWTLRVELVFYALCIVLLLVNSLQNIRRVAAVAIVFGFVHSLAMLMSWFKSPIMSADAAFWYLNLSMMLCGTLYRDLVMRGSSAHDGRLRACILGVLVYYLVIFPAGAVWAIGFERNAPVAYALGLLLFVVATSFVRIESRLTDWLGRISYSVYLFHPVVFLTLLWWLARQPPGSWSRTQHLGVYLLANLLLTLLLAHLVYRWIERPSIHLGHRLAHAYRVRACNRCAQISTKYPPEA
ncbi:MAG: acyltransferase [Dokdonella sp.]